MKSTTSILHKDFIDSGISWYKGIDSRLKIAFLVSFFAGVISFFFFIAHQPLHDHGMRMPWIDPHDQTRNGRWFVYVLTTLYNRADLPVILPLISIILNTASGVITALCWKKNSPTLNIIIVTLFISLYPAFLAIFFYTWVSPIYSFALFLSALSIYISSSLSFTRIILGSLLVMISMASYQTAISVTLTILLALSITKVFNTGKTTSIHSILTTDILPRVISVFIGILLYRISLSLFGIDMQNHATTTIEISEIIPRLIDVSISSFKHLYLTQPEFLPLLKRTLLALVLLAASVLITKNFLVTKSFTRSLLLILLLLLTVISTKFMFLISSNNNLYTYRYNFSLGYFYAFCAFIVVNYINTNLLKNMATVLCLFILVKYSYADLTRQHVIMRAQQHDLALANRILYRIESLPKLNLQHPYDLVRIGRYSDFRREILSSKGHKYDLTGGSHMDIGDITSIWAPAAVMKLLGSKVTWTHFGYNPNFKEKIKYARENLLQHRKPWPHESSVFIEKSTVYVYMK